VLSAEEAKIGIIGLGYVGLPLAVEFGNQLPTIGFDIQSGRINKLTDGKDSTLSVTARSESIPATGNTGLAAL